ncbi:MAG: M1 family aminopeptidase [Gemmatimonadota bacterium]
MKVRVRRVCWVLALTIGGTAFFAPPAVSGRDVHVEGGPNEVVDDFETWVRAFRELAPDPARGVEVSGLSVQKDRATLHFDRGTIHALMPIDGRTIGIVFMGEGRLTSDIPDALEQGQMERMFEVDGLAQPFRSAVLLFTDGTLESIEAAAPLAPLPLARDAEREVEEARDYLTDGDGWAAPDVLLPLVNNGPGFFYAHVAEDRGDPVFFTVDPHNFEEVSIAVKADRTKRRSTVARFHRLQDYETGTSIPEEALDLIDIRSYQIETRIDDGLDLEAVARMNLEKRLGSYEWIPFSLYPELEVDSVRWSDGQPVTYYRPEESFDLWLQITDIPDPSATLDVYYQGDMMDRPQGLWVQLGTHSTWFPVYQSGRLIPYSLTFTAPEDLLVTTVGQQMTSITEGDYTTTTWQTPPIGLVTFNIGDFDVFESEPPQEGDPGLTVLVNETAHRRLGAMASEAGMLLLEQRDMAEMVAIDVRNAFSFFNEVYGPTTVRDFVATEIPYSHGEAYPGLVMLAWSTFRWTSSEGFDEIFRAHEVAHQWWGIGVTPATYRDWWIAEGFSEFSGWWYAARARGSIDMYYRRLEETRELLLDRRGEAAPIQMGRRAGSRDHPEDYQLQIYFKGAWVLHMLRGVLTDPDTGNDDLFVEVMNTFYQRHLGQKASTASFQAVVEEVVGSPMGWFFQQWVYQSDIPTYRFSHKYEEQPDGSVVATVRVRQEDVGPNFQMLVPILLDFGEEGSAQVRITVSGPETEVVLPTLPRIPDSIEFNPFEAVLAETHTEGWRN